MEPCITAARGIIFILSAPFGRGQDDYIAGRVERNRGLESVRLTDDARPRENEVGGLDYHFVSEDEFNRRRGGRDWPSGPRVFDASYGTPRAPLDDAVRRPGRHPARYRYSGRTADSRKLQADTVTIFVLPPSFAELEGRLRRRGTESEDAIERRLNTRARRSLRLSRIRLPDHQRRLAPFGCQPGGDRRRRAAARRPDARGVRAVEELALSHCPDQLDELVARFSPTIPPPMTP